MENTELLNIPSSILLIDDNEMDNFVHSTILKRIEGITSIAVYEDARDALIFLEEGNLPDWILLDINMPNMNGWQFLEEFPKYQISCHLYMLSSSIDPYDINQAKSYDAVNGYVTKPLSMKVIQDMMKTDDYWKN